MDHLIAKRNDNSHKGTYGRVAIIAGSRGMTGAPFLSSQGALRTGSGLVYTIIPESLETVMSIKLTEAIIRPIKDKDTGHFLKDSIEPIIKEIKEMDCIALGPGIGVDKDRIQLVSEIIRDTKVPMVVDADGINCIAENIEMLNQGKDPIIITPHPGEMASLLNKDIQEIEKNRQYYSQYISEKYNIIVVLKGNKTIVTSPEGQTYINKTGNPGMATAGSGDVLTGIIASLLGQRLDPFDAAKLGVYLHGLAGDITRDRLGEYGMIASYIIEAIPYAIMGVENA